METTKNTTKVQEMKVSELVEILANWDKGTAPISIVTVTTPKINKEGKQKFGEVMKVANVGGLLGYDYQNSVNNQLEREQKLRDFLSESLWKGKGRRVTSAMAEHIDKGTKYLTYKHQQTNSVNYIDSQGNVINVNDLKEFFYKSNFNKQGTEKPIYHREVKISNIRYIKMNSVKYKIVH